MKKSIKNLLIILLFTFIFLLTGCEKDLQISLGYKNLSMNVGDILLLSTNFKDLDPDGIVVWESSDPSVASVTQDGEISALNEGYTYISATLGEFVNKIYLSVSSSWKENREIFLSGNQMVIINNKTKLVAQIELKENESIIWSSLNEDIATVDQNGNVKGILTGLATIRATLSSNSSITKDITVLVRKGSGIQDVIYNYIYSDSYEVTGEIDLTSLNDKVTDMVSAKRDSIIGVSNYVLDSFGEYTLDSIGSAVIYKKEVSSNGYKYFALTNYHVVEANAKIAAYIGNDVDKEFDATVIKTDEDNDLAIITFEYNNEITPIELANNDSVTNGDFVVAIGNPTGFNYYNSVTFGIASYVDRVLDENTAVYIQHDAAINPGNSGGALLDLDGKLIGINTLKIAKYTVEGMGFAIDIKTVKDFINK